MTTRIIIKPKAEDELYAAAEWYEARSPTLGFQFLAEVDACLDRICDNPRQFRFHEAPVRIAHVHRFPFGIFYEHSHESAFIIAVMRLSRRPDRWRTG